MRSFVKFIPADKNKFISSLLLWANEQDTFCFFNEKGNGSELSGYDYFRPFAGVGKISELMPDSADDFTLLKKYVENGDDIRMGFLSYDLKNQIEKLTSENHDGIEMPGIHFFQPELFFALSENADEIEVRYFENRQTREFILSICKQIENKSPVEMDFAKSSITPACRVTKDKYIETVSKIKEHIQLGDVYELNYCVEFFAENVEIDPVNVYRNLMMISPAPFSCFYKVNNRFLISASPEQFLKKEGNKIIARPMKGTAPRGKGQAEDAQIKKELFNSEKERAENVMIVDLVRNDLSKTAVQKSVKVDELYGIYSFPQVHQMVSTVSSVIREDVHPVDVIRSAFPMGSMTGAPKVKAMELIEKYEITKRGLFSGAVGYFTAGKDPAAIGFNFNVVIRSIQYNAEKKYLSFMVGSAITINSDPESEYNECLLKAQALIKVLQ